jgi:ABC-2 type transport system permease protein
MKAWCALLVHSARRSRVFLSVTAVLLLAFQILLAFAAKELQELNTFSGLAALVPDFMRQIFGASLLTLMSFRGVACLGYFHVAIVAFLVGLMISLATEPAGEAETRFLDVVLAHPLARHCIITRTMTLLVGCIIFVLGAMMLGTWAGLHWLAASDLARETWAVVPQLAFNLGMLLLSWGGIALMLAAIAHRRNIAAATASLLAMASYMIDLISQVWKPLRPLARYSLFHYYNSLNLITGSRQVTHDVQVLACVAAAAFALSYLFFQYRDL